MADLAIGGHLVARQLREEGCRTVFTLCGGHVAPIYDGCLREGIRILDTRHEQAAAHAADAWARLTGEPGVAIVTAGPGVTDAVTGMANALAARSPVVLLGGAAERRVVGRGALQELDQPSLLRPVTKWTATCTDASRLRELTATAFRMATTGVPGPVFLELPFDVLTAQAPFGEPPPRRLALPRQPPDPLAVEQTVWLLGRCERPLLVCGSGVSRDRAEVAVAALADEHRLPTCLNGTARGALPWGHPANIRLARRYAMRAADLVLVAGAPLDFRLAYGGCFKRDAHIIQIDSEVANLGANRALDVAMIADTASALEAIGLALGRGKRRFSTFLDELIVQENEQRAAQARYERSDAVPMNHFALARALADATANRSDVLWIGDGGDVVAIASKVIPVDRTRRWLDPGPFGCLGVGGPFALAAKAVNPDMRIVVVSGDGSFGLNGFELESCVRQGLPVVVVVGNDAAWGQIRGPQKMIFGEERAPATRLTSIRYDRIVEGMGGAGCHVERPSELRDALRDALDEPKVTCIDVRLDPDFMLREGLARLTV